MVKVYVSARAEVESLPQSFPFRIRKRKARPALPAAICKLCALGGLCSFGHLPPRLLLARLWAPAAWGGEVLPGDTHTRAAAP